MKDVFRALALRKEINRMDFEKFINKYVVFECEQDKEKVFDHFPFCGLHNTDFINMELDSDSISVEGKAIYKSKK